MPDGRPLRSPYQYPGRTYSREQVCMSAPPPRQEAPPPTDAPVSQPPPKSPSNLLQLTGLDEEKLVLIAVIVILARSGADWTILAALIYIML